MIIVDESSAARVRQELTVASFFSKLFGLVESSRQWNELQELVNGFLPMYVAKKIEWPWNEVYSLKCIQKPLRYIHVYISFSVWIKIL